MNIASISSKIHIDEYSKCLSFNELPGISLFKVHRWRGGYTNKLRATHKAVCNPKVWLFNGPSRFELSLDRLRVAEIQLDAPYKSEPGEARVLPSLKYRLTILLLSLSARKLSVNRLNLDISALPLVGKLYDTL